MLTLQQTPCHIATNSSPHVLVKTRVLARTCSTQVLHAAKKVCCLAPCGYTDPLCTHKTVRNMTSHDGQSVNLHIVRIQGREMALKCNHRACFQEKKQLVFSFLLTKCCYKYNPTIPKPKVTHSSQHLRICRIYLPPFLSTKLCTEPHFSQLIPVLRQKAGFQPT